MRTPLSRSCIACLLAILMIFSARFGLVAFPQDRAKTAVIFEPPGSHEIPRIDESSAILVNGRRVTPAGRLIRVQSYNWGMTLGAQDQAAALVSPNTLTLMSLGKDPQVRRILELGSKPAPQYGKGSYMGCAFSPDGKLLYYGSADEGFIKILEVQSGTIQGTIDINGTGFADSFIGDFVLSPDGRMLYAVDQFNYRLVSVDLKRKKVVQSVRVGRNPFGISLSDDGRTAWVSNIGMFEYSLIPGITRDNRSTAGLDFPPFGIPSAEAENGVTIDGRKIPGLGSPNHPDAMSVFKVDLASGRVVKKIKTGYLVGVERDNIRTVGGASPSTVVVGSSRIFVSNATNDNISVINPETGEIATHIDLKVPGMEKLRGVLPFGMALDKSNSRLYVSCSGLNAVAVIDTETLQLLGYIPAGWFCSAVEVSRDGRQLYIASAKGLGSGPNGGRGFVAPKRGTHPGDIMQGLFQIVPVPDALRLAEYTQQVYANTSVQRSVEDDGRNPLPPAPGMRRSPIRHVVFIVKENRTFDQVFGQRRGLRGDPVNTDLGMKMSFRNKDGSLALHDVDVSPNHQALADRFAISDNFYCDSDQSNTGHRWVVGVYPNEWVEVNARSRIEARLFSSAPGRRYVSGSSATINPEDYNEAGALWEHLARWRIPFFNFGFGTEMPASIEEQLHKFTGMHMSVNFPLPKPLFDNTSRKFATYNMAIPDQFRVDMFEEEMRDKWESGKEPFPPLVTMVLPNDHLTKEHPAEGYPFRESYMADNDLALGRVIQKLSHSRWWKEMLVIVVEDDPQGGQDHVDAHRSILMLIGPYVKRGYVSHTLASFGSVIKMIFTLLDIPYLNQFDAAASLPRDFFSDQPDYEPYNPLPVDKRLFDPDIAFKPFDRRFNWKGMLESQEMDRLEDMRRDQERKLRSR
jgi:DNA-binding beta-propeller fold protein YncE